MRNFLHIFPHPWNAHVFKLEIDVHAQSFLHLFMVEWKWGLHLGSRVRRRDVGVSSFSLSYFKGVELNSVLFIWSLALYLFLSLFFFLFFSLKKQQQLTSMYCSISLCHFTLDNAYQLFICWVLFHVFYLAWFKSRCHDARIAYNQFCKFHWHWWLPQMIVLKLGLISLAQLWWLEKLCC